MFYWYKFLTYLFYPFTYFFLLIRKFKKKEHQVRFKEKLSKINLSRGDGFLVWFHVASVGEAMSILPLIEIFEKDSKINKILITSITLSSAQILEKKYHKNKKIFHQFLPLDIPKFVNKFLRHWSPNLSIFVDSEIWPNLIFAIKKNNIPLILVNGRITEKTFSKWNLAKKFAKKIFAQFDLCIASNAETEKFLKILGASNIKNYGNLKFSKSKIESNKFLDNIISENIKNRKIWCAASTHNSEEIFCAKTHLVLKKKYNNILTVIIPRHINRVNKINNELKKMKLKTCLYSNRDKFNFDTDILLVDAYGENLKFFKKTKYVFLGGSLIKHGGQNPIEPSRLGCKIFYGPHIDNFFEIYEYLKSLKIAQQIQNSDELVKYLDEEFAFNKVEDNQIIEKIENYGESILNNVTNDLKKYINT